MTLFPLNGFRIPHELSAIGWASYSFFTGERWITWASEAIRTCYISVKVLTWWAVSVSSLLCSAALMYMYCRVFVRFELAPCEVVILQTQKWRWKGFGFTTCWICQPHTPEQVSSCYNISLSWTWDPSILYTYGSSLCLLWLTTCFCQHVFLCNLFYAAEASIFFTHPVTRTYPRPLFKRNKSLHGSYFSCMILESLGPHRHTNVCD